MHAGVGIDATGPPALPADRLADLVEASLEDLRGDFEELRYLVVTGIEQLRLGLAEIDRARAHLHAGTGMLLASEIERHRHRLEADLARLDRLASLSTRSWPSVALV
ncbi:MAG: hypothetical protein ACRDJ5_12125, partial [Actinomycetota bacterium]